MNITVIDNGGELHQATTAGLMHFPEMNGLDKDPVIIKHRPKGYIGGEYLAKLAHDNAEYWCWIKPVPGGTYVSCDPVFLIKEPR